jgi:hypothetical protein
MNMKLTVHSEVLLRKHEPHHGFFFSFRNLNKNVNAIIYSIMVNGLSCVFVQLKRLDYVYVGTNLIPYLRR